MCLGIPMQIDVIDGYTARCSAKGVSREVSTFLMQGEPLEVGDFIIVHVGYAIQKVSPQEAQSTWELLDEMLALEDEEARQAQTASER
jgi:hydrogenase expression/formation protein HypC